MSNINNDINYILSKWNPLKVPDNIATSEYTLYILKLKSVIEDEQKIKMCLIDILKEDMAIEEEYIKNNIEEINYVSREIYKIKRC